jgi:hypothetical protein
VHEEKRPGLGMTSGPCSSEIEAVPIWDEFRVGHGLPVELGRNGSGGPFLFLFDFLLFLFLFSDLFHNFFFWKPNEFKQVSNFL